MQAPTQPGAVAQSLRFAGVDSVTAERIASLGPNLGHPDLKALFSNPSLSIHGPDHAAAQQLSAAAYASDTSIAISRAESMSPHVVAHEATHVVQQRSGTTR